MATHSSVLAWRIPGTAEPGGLPSMGSHRVGHDQSDLAAAAGADSQKAAWRIPFLNCLLTHINSFIFFNDSTVHAAAAAAKLLQSCLTLCNPIDSSPPGSPSLGFSRQEHWSGLPFPSLMHESER